MKKNVVFLLILFLLCLLNISVNPANLEYRSFIPLSWKKLPNCAVEQRFPFKVLDKVYGTYVLDGREGFCETESFELAANEVLEIEYFNSEQGAGRIEVVDAKTGVLQTAALSDPSRPEPEDSGSIDWPMRWRVLRVNLNQNNFSGSIYLRLVDTNPAVQSIISIRGRLNKYTAPNKIYDSFKQFELISFLLLFILLSCNLRRIFSALSNLRPAVFFAVAFLITFLLNFRFNHYFYWDEWHTIEQFFKDGFAAAFHRHNEHRVPLLFLFYFLEICTFRDNYFLFLLTSYLIHALNSLLLAGFFRRILRDRVYAKEVSYLIGFFYAISALHSETLRWAIDQASIISFSLILVALNSFIDFIFNARKKDLLILALSSAMAPLFFGNGFVLAAHLFLLLVLILSSSFFSKERIVSFGRVAMAFFTYVLASTVPISFYLILKQGEGFNYSHMNLAQLGLQVEQIKDYLVVGTQYATILRGLGLFYTVSQEGAFYIFGPGFVWGKYRPEEVCAFFGLAVSGLLFLLCFFSQEPKRYLKFWLYGQLLLLVCLLLPAVARSRFGAIQSLALRYQTQTLIGLLVLIAPWLERLYKIVLFEDKKVVLAKLLILFYLFSHLQMSLEYNYFSSRGVRNKNYLAQLEEWQDNKMKYPLEKQVLLEPLLPANFTPKRTPAMIEAVYRQLKG